MSFMCPKREKFFLRKDAVERRIKRIIQAEINTTKGV